MLCFCKSEWGYYKTTGIYMAGHEARISNLKPNHFAWVCTHHRQDQITKINTWRKKKITNPTSCTHTMCGRACFPPVPPGLHALGFCVAPLHVHGAGQKGEEGAFLHACLQMEGGVPATLAACPLPSLQFLLPPSPCPNGGATFSAPHLHGQVLCLSGTLCSAWAGWPQLRHLARCWRNLYLRYLVRALGVTMPSP